jgi:Mu-like prophage major head subunit gpT
MAQGAPVNLDLLRRTTRADFYAQLGVSSLDSIYPQICMEVESDSDVEVYSFFGAPSKPVRTNTAAGAVGSGVTYDRPFRDYSMTLKNATWVWIQSVERDIVEDAKLDQIRVRAQQGAASGMSFMDERLSAIIETPGNAYEGTAFYGPAHHGVTSAAKDNDTTSVAATGTVPTVSEFEDGFSLAVAAIRGFTDDQGRIANGGNLGLVCMVDTVNERVARAVLEKGPVPGTPGTGSGNTGVWHNQAKVIVNPYLATQTGANMYLFVTSQPIKAIVAQKRIPWEFKFILEGDDWEKRDLAAMKGRARFDFLAGDWKKTCRHVWS